MKIRWLIFPLFFFAFLARPHAQNLVITEIMYNVPGSDTLEYLELFNNSGGELNLSGYSFTRGIVYAFPNMQMVAGEYLVLARDANAVSNAFGISALQWTSGGLSNNGEDIVIRDNLGLIADTVNYQISAPWPTGPIDPNGGGASIILCNPFVDNNIASNWEGASTPTGVVVANIELLGHPGSGCPQVDISPPIPFNAIAYAANEVTICFNEIVNSTAEIAINYTGLGGILSAVLDPGGTKVVLTLQNPLTDFDPTMVTIQNVQDANNNSMTGPTVLTVTWIPGGPARDLVITEINYNPPDTTDILEFIEIYNNSGTTLNLFGTYFTDGVDFVFPEFTLNDGEFVVVAKDAFNFNNAFGFTPFQWNTGSLSNGGERIALTNHSNILVDEVTFGDMNNPLWPDAPDGAGPSLSLCPVWSDNAVEANWLSATTTTGVMVEGIEILANPGQEDVSCGVGVEEVSENRIFAYPNPLSDFLVLETGLNSEYFIEIYNVLGHLVFTGFSAFPETEISLNHLPAGTYYLSVQLKEQPRIFEIEKIVVIR